MMDIGTKLPWCFQEDLGDLGEMEVWLYFHQGFRLVKALILRTIKHINTTRHLVVFHLTQFYPRLPPKDGEQINHSAESYYRNHEKIPTYDF